MNGEHTCVAILYSVVLMQDTLCVRGVEMTCSRRGFIGAATMRFSKKKKIGNPLGSDLLLF